MERTPKRRWYQFSLRTMFVVMTLACAVLAWMGYSLNWIKQRHEALHSYDPDFGYERRDRNRRAPFGLWLFGEKPMDEIWCRDNNPATLQKFKRLFPEAKVARDPSSPDN
jgi:hypothetical protein